MTAPHIRPVSSITDLCSRILIADAELGRVRATPVPSCVATTVAPGMTAADASRTSPTSVAVVTCASTRVGEYRNSAVVKTRMLRMTWRMTTSQKKAKHAALMLNPKSRTCARACAF